MRCSMATEQKVVEVYTDGSCLVNPGLGGWAAIIKNGRETSSISGSDRMTTNNRMELTAALEALKKLPKGCEVRLYTDSQYLKLGVTEWMPNWKTRGWQRKGGKLANIDLWQSLDLEIQKHHIQWHWVKGHNGHRENEMVDRLARQAIFGKKTSTP